MGLCVLANSTRPGSPQHCVCASRRPPPKRKSCNAAVQGHLQYLPRYLPEGMVVHHKSIDSVDNYLGNLALVTAKFNLDMAKSTMQERNRCAVQGIHGSEAPWVSYASATSSAAELGHGLETRRAICRACEEALQDDAGAVSGLALEREWRWALVELDGEEWKDVTHEGNPTIMRCSNRNCFRTVTGYTFAVDLVTAAS